MTRILSYQTVDGKICYRRACKPGPKPLPPELRRTARVMASVTQAMRERLDKEIAGSLFSESDIVEISLRRYFAEMDGLLRSNPLNT